MCNSFPVRRRGDVGVAVLAAAVAITEADVGRQQVAGGDVLDRGARPARSTVMPPLTSVADADVAVAVDGQRVEQLIAGQPGEAHGWVERRTGGELAGEAIDAPEDAAGERLGPVQRRAVGRQADAVRGLDRMNLLADLLPSALA